MPAEIVPTRSGSLVECSRASARVCDSPTKSLSCNVQHVFERGGRHPRVDLVLRSTTHRCAELVSREFVAAIPMMSRLLAQLGVGTSWLDEGALSPNSNVAGTFHTPDAKVATDEQGRLVIPAREFVEQNDVKSVFGVGSTYADGTLLALMCFTSEFIERAASERYLPLFVQFRHSTAGAVSKLRIFS